MIVLITPTGGRPEQIKNCHRFMMNQTYKGEVLWIIVDDCIPRTTELINSTANFTIYKIYPSLVWRHGWNTQSRNITEAIRFLSENYKANDVSAIFIIEDDDWYKPIYLSRMTELLNGFIAIGERNTIYYNVKYRKYIIHANTEHSSLFQTAFTWEGLEYLRSSLTDKFIDIKFWKIIKNRYLFNDGNLAIGIKGMAGRGGIGAGHSQSMVMIPDYDFTYLTNLIGQNDASLYAGYFGDRDLTQHSLFTRKRL